MINETSEKCAKNSDPNEFRDSLRQCEVSLALLSDNFLKLFQQSLSPRVGCSIC